MGIDVLRQIRRGQEITAYKNEEVASHFLISSSTHYASWKYFIFSTLCVRVLKVYTFVTHLGLQRLIIQTVSKNKLISKNAY